jgi:hypothetical protein
MKSTLVILALTKALGISPVLPAGAVDARQVKVN